MSFRRSVSVFAILIASASLVAAQEGPPSNYEHLKKMSFLVGNWKAEVTADEAIPSVAEKGDKLQLQLSVKWALKKNALQVKIKVRAKKKLLEETMALIGWNAAEKKIVAGSMTSSGSIGLGQWMSKDNKWYRKGTFVKASGEKGASTIVISEIGDNSFVSQTVDIVVDGKEKPESPTTTWTRAK